jgi:hypothetical protein
MHGGLAKGKAFGEDPQIRSAFLNLCERKSSNASTTTIATESQKKATWGGDKRMKQDLIRGALKQKMESTGKKFSWKPEDWIISEWPTGVRSLTDPKEYKVEELDSIYAVLNRISFISKALPRASESYDVSRHAFNALSAVIECCKAQRLGQVVHSSDASSSSSSSSTSNASDKLRADLERLTLITNSLSWLMETPLSELRSVLPTTRRGQ